ncbi:hypothetical protein K443DRAFT_109921 [Laccaria amethystina LaAM-08-1]|uniref:Mitochondrial distribution and morphology protein 12 n=1 Tax=Laccaria amethystina LaAM-08-1 TaxID=1095629 RepID=A0A0C9WSJ7_9AGAR|nr:hypothetical protein K443DRAFT_109921 [Laccaria amethystina LaAM-08-1]
MSIDLEWCKLDSSLATYLIEVLNRQLGNAERPSFIGPVEVTSLDFGSVSPDVELVDLRDIYRDFLEDDEEDSDRGPVKVAEGAEDVEGFEWVGEYDRGASIPATNVASSLDTRSDQPDDQKAPLLPPPAQNPYPNLQLHLHVNWHSNLRITLTTSLLINYPSPMFMSLPIKLSVTGLIFVGELAVAYEGQRRRVHLCILDDLDPYGPAGDRQRLLPSIYIESEIGQADKHVLKNVTRVERFIQDVIRKTVEEELVFPNFHTIVMADQ